MKMSTEEILFWQKALIRWFTEGGESYPWRETTDPYAILVSELMLQQTQIKTVLARRYFENWMEKFPDVGSLATAGIDDVLKSWEGLGYYNRARNLQKAAIQVMDDYNGEFPSELSKILDLPGVGPYTAGAVCSFAFNTPATIVDGNVIRVLARAFNYTQPVDTTVGKKAIWEIAGELTSNTHPRAYNSAIMELGQKVCTKGKPKCEICPVSGWCASRDSDEGQNLPIKSKAIKITYKTEEVLLLVENDQIFLSCETGSRRNGLWRLPLLGECELDEMEQIGQISYAITRYQVEMRIFGGVDIKNSRQIAKKMEGTWFDLSDSLPALGAPYLRAIEEFIEVSLANK